MQDISSHLGVSFQHILKEANSMADGLARKRVLHSSISFDVQVLLFFVFLVVVFAVYFVSVALLCFGEIKFYLS